ncbi:MAG: LytTR family DNA-binding domain-containing protein [Candidatus Aminicenantales bacterium]
MSLRVMIIDDEKLARSRLRRLLARHSDVEVVGEAGDGAEAGEMIRKLRPDALFLDIKMPRVSGFDLLRNLEEVPYVVFTTAYDQFALQAFEENTVDYLLKPVTEEALDRALAKLDRIARKEGPSSSGLARLLETLEKRERIIKRFSVKIGDKFLIVPDEKIAFFEARDKYTYLQAEERSYIIPFTLKDLEERADPDVFLRVHRSFIVNLENIASIHQWFGGRLLLKMRGGKEIMVSQSFAGEFRKRLQL